MSATSPTRGLIGVISDVIKSAQTPAGGEPPKKETEEKKADAAATAGPFGMIKEAVERYRTTVKWIVTTYAAIWVVLVGTAPFAGLGDLSGLRQAIAFVGLLIAGIGAILGVYATSRVLEPEDASLGELTTRGVREVPRKRNLIQWVRWHLRDKLDNDANRDMWTLFSSEPKAYLAADSVGADNEARQEAVRGLIRKVAEEQESDRVARVAVARAADADRPAAEREAEAAKIEFDDMNSRRDGTLAVAIAHEVRGKYLSSRRILLTGGGLILIGTLMYLLQVAEKQEKDDDKAPAAAAATVASLTPAQVRLQPDTWVRLEATAGGQGCLGGTQSRETKLVTPGHVQGGEVSPGGPWQIVLQPADDPRCRPISFELKLPDGRVAAAVPKKASGTAKSAP